MKKREVEKIFRKLDLKVRTIEYNYGWLVLDGKKYYEFIIPTEEISPIILYTKLEGN